MPISKRELQRLDRALCEQRNDAPLYCLLLMRLDAGTIARYSLVLPSRFAHALVLLGRHTSPAVPFELCDELAAFYARVFSAAHHPAHRRLALSRLLALGASHRRYQVADVVREVLWSARSCGDLELVLSVLDASPHASWYAHPNTFRGYLHPSVAVALTQARETRVSARPRRGIAGVGGVKADPAAARG
jgi:hypothetical protein